MSSNTERLEAAGLIKMTPLPPPYEAFVAELSDAEIETLVSVKRRLDSVSEVEAHGGRRHAAGGLRLLGKQ